MCRRKQGKPPCDVLFIQYARAARKKNQWIENRAPGNLILLDRIVEMAGTDKVLG